MWLFLELSLKNCGTSPENDPKLRFTYYLATFWRFFLGCVENLLKCPVWTDKNILLCIFWNMRQVCRHRLSIQPKNVLGFFNWEYFNEISHRFFLFREKKSQLKCLILTEKTTHYALVEKWDRNASTLTSAQEGATKQ